MDIWVGILKNDPALPLFAPSLIKRLPAVGNLASILVRPSFPQVNNTGIFPSFNKSTLTAVVYEWHQTVCAGHHESSGFWVNSALVDFKRASITFLSTFHLTLTVPQ
jgi:hypothetical protein